ncbi:DUF397 domain-containing protein [Actinomadura macrotermitis]|uniref:DUF397 domain-containing protein n=1 Tax=Actinomadura macrotermitis TaxID=2585200 RepID=A0A7K0BRW3_9ACTN|nr:hypothetical protein [Actinomadura macrotermitis]
MTEFSASNWRKASYSGGEHGGCVEAGSDRGQVGIRDTTNRAGGSIVIEAERFRGILEAVRAGKLDL